MPFSIQTKHASTGFLQGDVIAIRPEGFQYYEGDCRKEWLKAGRSIEGYPSTFAIIYCTNPEMDGTEPEVQALIEEYEQGNPNAEFRRRRYLAVPTDYDNPYRVELRGAGETRAKWDAISSLIIERT